MHEGINREEALRICLTKPPAYNILNRQKLRLTQEVQDSIDLLLEENKKKLHTGLGKQRLKKIDILIKLQEQGFDIGYTTVCNYIRGKQKDPTVKEAFIRQAYDPGSSCEFD